MDKTEIGLKLVGLPPATARGLRALFGALIDEVNELRAKLEPTTPAPTAASDAKDDPEPETPDPAGNAGGPVPPPAA